MDWNSLKYILAIAEQGSISAAARYLNITHSTVSRKLSDMEQDLGFSLFLRGDQGYQISDQGRPFLETAEKFQHQWLDLISGHKNGLSHLMGKVRVTVPEDICLRLVQPLIPEFRNQYPEIHLHLIVENRLFSLEKREVDLAIRPTMSVPDHLIARKICPLTFGIYAHRDYPLQGLVADRTNLDILAECDWLDHQGVQTKPLLPPYDRFQSQIIYSCNSFLCLAEAVAQKQGIALLPDFVGSNDPRLFCIHRPDEQQGHFQLWLLKHPDLRHSRTIQAVAKFLCDHIKPVPVMHPVS